MLSIALIILPFLCSVRAAIGPEADLHIVNKNIAPDGFTRSYVNIQMVFRIPPYLLIVRRAVLAGSTANNVAFPGPLITGFKVCCPNISPLQMHN